MIPYQRRVMGEMQGRSGPDRFLIQEPFVGVVAFRVDPGLEIRGFTRGYRAQSFINHNTADVNLPGEVCSPCSIKHDKRARPRADTTWGWGTEIPFTDDTPDKLLAKNPDRWRIRECWQALFYWIITLIPPILGHRPANTFHGEGLRIALLHHDRLACIRRSRDDAPRQPDDHYYSR